MTTTPFFDITFPEGPLETAFITAGAFTFDTQVTYTGPQTEDPIAFSGENVSIVNNSNIEVPVTQKDGLFSLFNTGTIAQTDVQNTLNVAGNSQANIANIGTIEGRIQFSQNEDIFINGGTVNGQIRTGGGDDYILNGAGATITGFVSTSNGNDVVQNAGSMGSVNLSAGNDVYVSIDGQGTATGVMGGSGEDSLTGGSGKDVFNGGTDSDFLFGAGGNDKLNGAEGDDIIRGGGGKDQLIGGAGDDKLNGGGGNDRLDGGVGEDTLNGGNGNDRLTGGADADTFKFNNNSGADVITDFVSGTDTLRLGTRVGETELFYTAADVLANTTFFSNRAVIDLTALYEMSAPGGEVDDGMSIKLMGVTALTEADIVAPGLPEVSEFDLL
ncbi:MAG: calcium-binding protein [Pseudomonadota bacterium]